MVELVRNLMAHGEAREGKWRGNWRMEWVASTLTPPPNMLYPALLKLMCTPRLPAFDWTDAPTDLNGLVRLGERRNLLSARVPSRSARAIAAYFLAVIETSTTGWRKLAALKTEIKWADNIKYWVDLLSILCDKRYLTVTDRKSLQKGVIGNWDLPSSGILRKE